jgi:hypothetical protein
MAYIMKHLVTKVVRKASHLLRGDKSADFTKVSFSQIGEDLIVDFIFQVRGIQKPTYIDIGAFHPEFLSNTAFF